MSTTTEETVTGPPPTVREPGMLEQVQGLETTARRVVVERDDARARLARAAEDLAAVRLRAELAESYGVAMDNVIRSRDAEIRDLRARLADAQAALVAAVAAAQAPRAAYTESAPPSTHDAPQRPVRCPSWRRPPRRH